VPVTAKLFQRFYERFGDEITNELVDWFNNVDATYRSDLREINELNFGRFDAKVEQRFAESDARTERRFAEFDRNWEKRFSELDAKWEKRFSELDAKWEKRFSELEATLERRFTEIEVRWEKRFAGVEARIGDLRVELHAMKSDLIKWMFLFWTGALIAQAGLIFALLRR
jgi:hypothetical protein